LIETGQKLRQGRPGEAQPRQTTLRPTPGPGAVSRPRPLQPRLTARTHPRGGRAARAVLPFFARKPTFGDRTPRHNVGRNEGNDLGGKWSKARSNGAQHGPNAAASRVQVGAGRLAPEALPGRAEGRRRGPGAGAARKAPLARDSRSCVGWTQSTVGRAWRPAEARSPCRTKLASGRTRPGGPKLKKAGRGDRHRRPPTPCEARRGDGRAPKHCRRVLSLRARPSSRDYENKEVRPTPKKTTNIKHETSNKKGRKEKTQNKKN